MSKNQKNSKIAKNSKNYKVESLEPRLLMDADQGHTIAEWMSEIESCVYVSYSDSNSDFWSKERTAETDNIEGLYYQATDGLKYASMENLLDLSDTKKFLTNERQELADFGKSLISKLESEYKPGNSDYLNIVLTANEIKDLVCKKNSNVSFEGYKVSLSDEGRLTFYETSKNSFNVDSDSDLAKLYKADLYGTSANVRADFELRNVSSNLEFSFALDGSAENGVEFDSSLSVTTKFFEIVNGDENGNLILPKYGVLDLVPAGFNYVSIDTTWKHTDSGTSEEDSSEKNRTSKVDSEMLVNLSFVVNKANEVFEGSGLSQMQDKIGYIKSNGEEGWIDPWIENFNKFSMGKVLAKLQEMSSRLIAFQNGEFNKISGFEDFEENVVDFDGLLSRNAHSLLNLSNMLDSLINNPPASLQELVERIDNNPYRTDADILDNASLDLNQLVAKYEENQKNPANSKTKIKIDGNAIYIPFDLTYFVSYGDLQFKYSYEDVALSKDFFEKLLGVEVLENQTVKVQSDAHLSFELVVPFENSEKAKSDNKLSQIGLDCSNDQLAAVIGAKALIGEKMDYYYGSSDNIDGYALSIASAFGMNYCTDSESDTYALYSNMGWTKDGAPKKSGDEETVANEGKILPSGLVEMRSSVAVRGFVFEWNNSCKAISFDKKNEKFRDVNGIESAVSTLNAMFVQVDDALKDVHATVFGKNIVVTFSADDDATENIAKKLSEFIFKTAREKGKTAINSEDVFSLTNLSEIWISGELPPAHYDKTSKWTVTVGQESHELVLAAGCFNSARSVSEIATSLQGLINAMFLWDNVKSPTQLFVDSFEGKIRFYSMQDYAIDFDDDEFAKWLGFEGCCKVIDETSKSHFLIETSSREAEGLCMKNRVATQVFSDSRLLLTAQEVNISVTVDGTTKEITLAKREVSSLLKAVDVAELLQKKINSAFKWNEKNCKLFVSSINDCVRFRSKTDFSILFTDDDALNSAHGLGFWDVASELNEGSYNATISNMKEIVSNTVALNKLLDLLERLEDDTPLMEMVYGKPSFKVCASLFGKINSLEEFAAKLDSTIANMHNASISFPIVHVNVVDDRLCFSSVSDFSIVFYHTDFAYMLGFTLLDRITRNEEPAFSVGEADHVAEISSEPTNTVQTACMEIEAGKIGNMEKFQIDLCSLFSDDTLGEVNSCTIGRILNEIVDVLNDGYDDGPFGVDGVTFTAKEGYRIQSIKDINGFTIASLLGLVGKYGTSVDENRTEFSVVASLMEDYVADSKVARVQNFNLTVNNAIVNGSFKLPVQYGVFGETISGDLTGMSCNTFIDVPERSRLRDLNSKNKSLKTNYAGGGYCQVKLDQTEHNLLVKETEYIGSRWIVFKTDDENRITNSYEENREGEKNTLNSPNGNFRGAMYSMDQLYSDLCSATYDYWMKTIFNNPQFNFVNAKLPIYGKSILEIMGFDAKLRQLEALLTKDRSCSTIQELVEKISNEVGIYTIFAFENDTILFAFSWNESVTDQLVELDKLYLGRDDFKLTGDFKTYLTSVLRFDSGVSIRYDAGSGKIVPTTNTPVFSGFVTLKSMGINADVDVGVVKNGELKLETLQVESSSSKESNVFVNAKLSEYKEGSSQNVEMKVGGTLHAYRYGTSAGTITIGGVNDKNYSNKSVWDGSDGNSNGRFVCTNKTPDAIIVMKNGEKVGSNFTKGVVVDFTKIDLDLKSFNFLDGIRQAVDGLSNVVRRVQSGLNSVVANQGLTKIPLVGDSIADIGDSVSFLETDFVEPLRKYIYRKTEGFTAFAITEKLYTLLGNLIVPGLTNCADSSVWWAQKEFNRYYKGIQFYEAEDGSEVAWHLRIGTGFSLAKDADLDFGFPGLGLQANGGIDVSLDLILDIGFGYSKKDGAYILLSNGHENADNSDESSKAISVRNESYGSEHAGDDLRLMLNIHPQASIEGTLGFLAMTANVNNKEENPIVLGIDLNDGAKHNGNAVEDWNTDSGAKSVIGLKELKSNVSVEANLRGRVDLQMPMTLGIGGYTKDAPHIDTAFNLLWESDFGEGFGSVKKAGFDSIVFDCGSFVKNTVNGLIEKINKVIQPIQPLIDFLQSEIPVINKLPAGGFHMTVLELIKKLGEKKKMNFGFLDDIIEMKSVLGKLSDFIDKGISVSAFNFIESAKDQAELVYENALNQTGKVYNETLGKMEHEYDEIMGAAEDFATDAQQFVEGLASQKYKDATDFLKEKYGDIKGFAYKKLSETKEYKEYVEAEYGKIASGTYDVEIVKEYVLNKLSSSQEYDYIKRKVSSIKSMKDYVYLRFVEAEEFEEFLTDNGVTFAKETYDDIESAVKKKYGDTQTAIETFIEDKYGTAKDYVANKDSYIKKFVEEQFGTYALEYISDKSGIDAVERYKKYADKITEIYKYVKALDIKEQAGNLKDFGEKFLNGSIADVNSLVDSGVLDELGIEAKYVQKVQGYVDKIKSGTEKALSAVDSIKDLSANFDSYVDYGLDVAKDKVACAFNSVADKWNVAASSSSCSVSMPEFGGSWEFPIFENLDSAKNEIMKILMGGHADLVIFDMSPLQFNFDWQQSFAIIGPLCADVGFSFGADIDLCFGYDTYGVERWAKSGFKNVGALIDGFYVSDYDSNGVDIDEIVFHSGVVAGASICGRFGINVGLNLNVNLDFKDPNCDGRIRLSEMAEMLSLNPLNTFDVSASISARAYAYLDYFFGRKEWTLWSSGAFDLFKTASEQGDSVATQNGEDLVVSVGQFASNRNVKGDSDDCAETVTVEVKDAKKVKITVATENEKVYSNTYTIKGDTLSIYAGEGNDKVTVTGSGANFNVVVYGGEGNDSIDLSGLSFVDGRHAIVMGGAGKDRISGALSGTNYLFGDDGVVRYTPTTSDGKKRLSQVAAYSADEDDENEDFITGGVVEGDSKLRTVIFGGDGSDFLVGGSGESYVFGDFGRLTVDANDIYTADRYDLFDEGGDDLIYGGNDIDHIYAGAGNDLVNGNGGNDEIHGGQGNDVIYGGSGDDAIYGDDGTDVIFGDKPFTSSMMLGRLVDDRSDNSAQIPYTFLPHELKGQKDAKGEYVSPFFSTKGGVDTVKLFDFTKKYCENILDKNKTEDSKSAFASIEYINNWIRYFSAVPMDSSSAYGSDFIDGGNGADVIFGDDGRNYGDFKGASIAGGNDQIKGGAGNDFIDGDAGSDTIDAGSGIDVVYGGLGDDTLDGGAGNDFVFGDDGLAGYESVGDGTWFNKNGVVSDGKDVFGETIDTVGKVFGISDNAKSKKYGGDDTIIAGNGSDFVDGQSGDDTYKIQYMGGDNEAFTNVMDSGDDVNDTMKVLGTLDDDNVLVRASDVGLGMIALLPDGNDKKGTERVNYWKTDKNGGVENVSVETEIGNDTVAVDGSLTMMSIDAGAGNDTVNVGQLYDEKDLFNIKAVDSFTNCLIETTEGKLSVGNQYSLYVDGNYNNDVFNVLHASASLSLDSGIGNDVYNIKGFVDTKGNFVRNKGLVSLAGRMTRFNDGSQSYRCNSIVNYWGTDKNDSFVYSCESVLTQCYEIQSYGVDIHNMYGGKGNDDFYTMGSTPKKNIHTEVNAFGNEGADSFYNRSNTATSVFQDKIESLRLSTQNNVDILFDTVHDNSVIDRDDDVTVTSSSYSIDYNRILQVKKGEITKCSMKLSTAPKGTVYVKISVPVISEENQRSRNNLLYLVDDKGCYQTSITLTFNSKNYNKLQSVNFVLANSAHLYENRVHFLLCNVVTTSVEDVVSVPNIPFMLQGGTGITIMNHLIGSKIGFDIVDSGVICYDPLQGDLTKLSYGVSLRYTNSSGNVSYIPSQKESGKAYWFNIEKDRICIFDSLTGELASLTGRLDFVCSYMDDSHITSAYNLYDDCFIIDSSVMNFEYPIDPDKDGSGFTMGYLLIGEKLYQLGIPDENGEGYMVKCYGTQAVICDLNTGNPVSITGMYYVRSQSVGSGNNPPIWSKMYTHIGANAASNVENDGLPYTRIGDELSYAVLDENLENTKWVIYLSEMDDDVDAAPVFSIPSPLSLPSDSSKPTSLSRPVAPSPVASVSVSASDNVIELQSDMPDSVKVVAGETIRLKVSAAKASSADVYLMVNSEDGRALPAITWSWDDSNKKRVSVEEDGDLAYQVNLSNAENEDDFIYVFLHAAKDCNLVVTASSV